MKIKVLYLIFSSVTSSGGGHFYSLITISNSLKQDLDFKIINLGKVFAKPLHSISQASFINLNKLNFLFVIFPLIKQIKLYNPDVIHAFDFKSLFIARVVKLFFDVKIIYTKCGGVNGSNYIPDADIQILFSNENYSHFKKFGSKIIPKYLIPNRAEEVVRDVNAELDFKSHYNLKGKFVIMRISRFNPYYYLTFKQSINLFESIKTINSSAVLILLGKIQDIKFFQLLRKEYTDPDIIFVTENDFTNDASRVLNVADVVIATGRGVMEASSLNKVIFCPVKNSKYPIMLNNNTFQILSKNNFSERSNFNEMNIKLENSNFFKNDYIPSSKEIFNSFFNINSVKEEYLKIYFSKSNNEFRIFNFIGHLIRFFKP